MKKEFPRLRQQGPRYYYDHGGKPRKWEPLGKDWAKVLTRYQELQNGQCKSGGNIGWLIDRFLATRTGLAENTLTNYRKSAKVINSVFLDCPIEDLRRGHVLDFIDHYPSKQMARNAVLFLKMVLSYGVDRELLKLNPLEGLRLKGQSHRDRYLTDEEFMAVRAHLQPVYQVAADLAYQFALRVSGVVALKFSHIKDGVLSFHPKKSKRPISYRVDDEAEAVLERARKLPGAVRGLTVICDRHGKPIKAEAVSRAFAVAAKAAKIPNARFHDIRAKSASDEASTAQGRLGHTDAKTTAGYLRKPMIVSPIRSVKM